VGETEEPRGNPRTHRTGRTCKLQTKRPFGSVGTQTGDLHAVRRQSYPEPLCRPQQLIIENITYILYGRLRTKKSECNDRMSYLSTYVFAYLHADITSPSHPTQSLCLMHNNFLK